MFEAGLSVSIYLVNSIAGSNYMQKFLRGKYQKKFVLFAWTSLYFIVQGLIRGCKKFCVYETLNFPDKNPICKILLSIL
jgi:hypothetical protein